MYTMYAEIWDLTGRQSHKLYDPSDSTGEYALTSPKLTLEESAAGKLTFNIPSSNLCFDYFYNSTDQNGEANALNLYVDVRKDGAIMWKGRVVQKEIDFWNCIDVTCEGLLAVLNDTIQPPNYYGNLTPRSYLDALLTVHNSRVADNSRKIYLGDVTIDARPVDGLNRYTNYETTLECIIEKIVKDRGGRINLRYVSNDSLWVLDYLAEYEPEISQKIEFGKNLFDYSRSMTSEDYCTVVVPRGKQLDEGEYEDIKSYTTVASVNSGSIYVELTNADYSTPPASLPTALYGRIERVVDWSDIEDPQTLLTVGKEWLKDKQFGNMELEVTAMDMSYAGVAYSSISLGDTVRVVSSPHGLDRAFPVTKMEINIETPEDTMFTLGAAVKLSLTSSSNKQNKDTATHLAEIPTQQKLTTVFKQDAVDLINAATHGYVNIIQNEETGAEEFVVSDVPDYTAPYKESEPNQHLGVWRWTFGGLAFQKQYGSSDPDATTVALTRDGRINADLISTGHMVADRIYGGILTDQSEPHNFWFNLTTGQYQIKAIDTINESLATYATMSDLEITASGITSTVSQTYATKTALNNSVSSINSTITTISSTIEQTATQISLKVSMDTTDSKTKKYSKTLSGNNIASLINLDSTTVTIKAARINLKGYEFNLTANNMTISSTYFSVTKAGKVTATSGQIGGFTIDATSIRTKTLTDNSSSSIGLSTVEFIRTIGGTERTGLRFAIGSRFGVSATGILYTSYITATGGTVGGFTIDGTSIRSAGLSSNSSGSVALSTTNFTRTVAGSSRSNLRFAIGSKFGVTDTGVLYATDAVISGTISSTNATITGGYIQINSGSATKSIITLSGGGATATMTSSYFDVANSSNHIRVSCVNGIRVSYGGTLRVLIHPEGNVTFANSSGTNVFNWNGAAITNARTLYGDISETGNEAGDSTSIAKSIATGTWTTLRSIYIGSTSVGNKWIIMANVQFASNSKGYRAAVISTSAGSKYNVVRSAYYSSPPVNGDETRGMLIAEVSSGGTYYLNAYQNSGQTLTVYGFIRAIRIV